MDISDLIYKDFYVLVEYDKGNKTKILSIFHEKTGVCLFNCNCCAENNVILDLAKLMIDMRIEGVSEHFDEILKLIISE